ALAGIEPAGHDVAAHSAATYLDPTPAGRDLDRVREEIRHRLPESLPVPLHLPGRRIEATHELDPLGVCGRTCRLGGGLDHAPEIEGAERQPALSRDAARHAEQILH